jgi:glutamyl/glutaminyl-tRNA synthetase
MLGWREQVPAEQCGDLDDLRQGVTLVIRGTDLVSSSGRQIMLGEMLGRTEPPVFLHHPILAGPSVKKLSKAKGDAGVRELRAAGVTAADVIGRAAASVGLAPRVQPIAASAVSALFTAAVSPESSPNPIPSGLES